MVHPRLLRGHQHYCQSLQPRVAKANTGGGLVYKPKASAFKDHGWGPELAVIACQRVKASSCLKRSFPANSGRTRRIFESPILTVPPRPRCSVHAILGTRRRSTELLYTRLGSSAFPQLPYALTMTMLHFSPPSFFLAGCAFRPFFCMVNPDFSLPKKASFSKALSRVPPGPLYTRQRVAEKLLR